MLRGARGLLSPLAVWLVFGIDVDLNALDESVGVGNELVAEGTGNVEETLPVFGAAFAIGRIQKLDGHIRLTFGVLVETVDGIASGAKTVIQQDGELELAVPSVRSVLPSTEAVRSA